jgi:hypothetical protein
MRYEIRDPQGRPREAGEGTLAVEPEALVLTPRDGRPLVVRLSDIDAFEADDHRICATLYTGDVLRAERLGAAFGPLAADLSAGRDAAIRRDLLLEREPPREAFPAAVHVSTWASPDPRPARVLVYRDQVAVVGDAVEPVLVPFAELIALRHDEADYAIELADDDGMRVVIRKAGARTGELVSSLRDALSGLDRRAAAILDGFGTGLDPMAMRELVRSCRDGRALKETEAETLGAGTWARLERAVLTEPDLRKTYETLRALGDPGQAWIGIREADAAGAGEEEDIDDAAPEGGPEEAAAATRKPGAKADGPVATRRTDVGGEPDAGAPGYRCWYYVRMGGVIAHEVVSEGSHATYLYRAGPDADGSVRALNRALRLLNFRREPIYAPEAELGAGRFARYRVAMRKLGCLRHARESFLGRALHTSPEGWRKAVEAARAKA